MAKDDSGFPFTGGMKGPGSGTGDVPQIPGYTTEALADLAQRFRDGIGGAASGMQSDGVDVVGLVQDLLDLLAGNGPSEDDIAQESRVRFLRGDGRRDSGGLPLQESAGGKPSKLAHLGAKARSGPQEPAGPARVPGRCGSAAGGAGPPGRGRSADGPSGWTANGRSSGT